LSVKIKIPGFFKNNLYLLVVAAWLITLSFIIDNYWSSTSNIKAVQNKMNNFVNDAETDFIKTLYDSSFRQHMERKTSGTGLGLAMCKRITEQMNGQIWFETAEGEGTSFFVQLPIVEDAIQ